MEAKPPAALLSTSTHLIPAVDANPSTPSFVLHVTQLDSSSKMSYLLWVGASSSDGRASSVKLGTDWSAAVPPLGTRPAVGTPLFRSGAADLALPMSTRLAKKLQSQIFLSLDLPSSLTVPSSSPTAHPNAAKILLGLELGIGKALRELEASGTSSGANDGVEPSASAKGNSVDAVADEGEASKAAEGVEALTIAG